MKKICSAINSSGRRCRVRAVPGHGYCSRHAKEYYTSLPKKRMSAGAPIFNSSGKLLIVKPTYKDHWTIPGGVIDQNESPRQAVIREIKEELGITITHVRFLSLDYLSPRVSQYVTKDENLQFIFYGGVLSKKQIDRIRLPKEELSDYKFVPVKKALALISGNLARRIPPSIQALQSKTAYYLEGSTRVKGD